MKINIFFFLLQPFLLFSQTTSISNSVNQFGIDVIQQFRDTSDYLISPASVSTAMGMTYLGALGETKEEIKGVFHYPEDQIFAKDFPLLINQFEGSYPNTSISLVNKLWAGNGRIKLNEQFVQKNKKYFNSTLDTLDFNDREKASFTINDWVANQTENQITDLIDPGFITSDLVLVLTNAIYFKSNWASKFDKNLTEKGFFFNEEKEKIEVDFMTNNGYYNSYEDEYTDILELPYADDSFSFLILLPKKSMIELEKQLTYNSYIQWVRMLTPRKFELLQLPKFKSSYNIKMNDLLIDLGMPSAFSSANFTAMGSSVLGPIIISSVIHETFMEFNEEGTEASAVTVVGMAARSMPPPPKNFVANRPFIYLLRHTKSNTILFIGKMSNPKY